MPYSYDEINCIEGMYQPSSVKNINTLVFRYWERALFHRAMSVIDITKIPDEWRGTPEDFFKMVLYRRGFLAILKTTKYGLIFQPCTLSGYRGIYYEPDIALITNPYIELEKTEYKIGEECEILKLTPDYMGIWDIIAYYAEKLATLDNAINMAIINSKFAYILAGRDKAAVEALAKIMDKINEGNPAVFLDKSLMNNKRDDDIPFQFIQRENLKGSYITTDLLQDCNDILNKFDAAIGIPTIPYEKKERVQNTEATLQLYDGASRSLTWINTLKNSNEKITAMFGPILDFELHYNIEEGDDNAVENNTDRTE